MEDVGASAAPSRAARGPLHRLYNWVLSWADHPAGPWALFFIAFAESSFFPIPPDVLQIALGVGKPKRSFRYAAISSVGSVLGGILGYLIGWGLWSVVDDFFFTYVPGFTPDVFNLVQQKYHENAFLAVFTAAFTPIPYKVFTTAGGVFQIPLATLVVASALGRSARFFLVGALIFKFGAPIKGFIDRYLNLLTIIFTVLLVGGFIAVKLLL